MFQTTNQSTSVESWFDTKMTKIVIEVRKKTTLSTSVYQYRLGFWQINYRLINLQVYHQCLGWSRCSRWSLLPGPSLHSVRKGISKSPWLSIVEWSDDTWFIMIWGTPLTSESSILTPYVMFLENAGEVEGIKQDLEQIESGAEPLHTPDRNDLRDSLHKNNPTTTESRYVTLKNRMN